MADRHVRAGTVQFRSRPGMGIWAGMSAGVGKSWIVGVGLSGKWAGPRKEGLACQILVERNGEWTVARWGEDRHDSSAKGESEDGLHEGRVVGRWNVMACQIAGGWSGASRLTLAIVLRHGNPVTYGVARGRRSRNRTARAHQYARTTAASGRPSPVAS